ncbi:queuosine precursor transporter [Pontibacillus litoralis]|uniref:Probable queuosine precursor transporter n=1 Tax=Pontibacillus litoralis JSM 072002 TaxID=1385512 RepID=A0A0A5G9W0_9BACI|nr:queuosine precursor transporter [Pontibacillus litoralis]KGX87910.1 membrane protein [Pontibacillus litoralis JSM 072002]
MTNEILWIIFAIVNFSMVTFIYRTFGKQGLFVWIGMSTVIANIQVTKTIEMFGLTATLGNIIYGTAFLATDILNEKYGKEDAKRAVWLGFFTLISMTVMMKIALLFTPAPDDFAHDALATLFDVMPRVALGSLLAYLVSQYFDVWIYAKLKEKFPQDKWLWVRNNGSTMISQLLDSLVFCLVAFYGEFPANVWLEVFMTTYIIKFLVAALDTPFLYVAKKFHQ